MSEWIASIMMSGVARRTDLELGRRQSGPRIPIGRDRLRLRLTSVHLSVRAADLQVAVPLHPSPDVERGLTNAKTCISGKRCHSSGIGLGAHGVRAPIAPGVTSG